MLRELAWEAVAVLLEVLSGAWVALFGETAFSEIL